MKIDVRNIKIAHSLSEETYAYTATVYVDGVRAFDASNHGTGGPDAYWPVKGYTGPSEREVDAWLKANVPPTEAYGMTLDHSLEIEVGNQLTAHVREQERKRVAKRFDKMLSGCIAILRDGALFTVKALPTAQNLTVLKLREQAKGGVIVNDADAATKERALLAYCPDLVAA